MGTVPSVEQVRAAFSALTQEAYPDADVEMAAATAGAMWGGTTDVMLLWLTAHLAVVGKLQKPRADGGSGVIRSQRVADMSVTYEMQAKRDGDAFYLRSEYGRTFLEMLRLREKRTFVGQVIR